MRAQGVMYNLVVQLVFLYGSKSWVVTDSMLKVLELFHNWVAIRISGMKSRRMTSGEWEWTLVAEALETDRMCPIK